MFRRMKIGSWLGTLMLMLMCADSLRAFSLLGPRAPWMTAELGYVGVHPPDIGGPMGIGDEYRWNVPVITYGFTPSFMSYFGTNGVAEVERAISVLDALPDADSLDPSNHSVLPVALNRDAADGRIFDLKSASLGALVNVLGLASPQQYVWTLRHRSVSGGFTNYSVVQRNYDPFSLLPTNSVNGILFTYRVLDPVGARLFHHAAAIPSQVDPLALVGGSAAGILPVGHGIYDQSGFNLGSFWTGLSADDVGGLRYLYSRSNINAEVLPRGTTTTNGLPAVNAALRPGVGKIVFRRMSFDTRLEQVPDYTNRYADVFLSNGVLATQTVQRVHTKPDILFSMADDLAPGSYGPPMVDLKLDGRTNLWSLNSGTEASGPGVINGQAVISFGRFDPGLRNSTPFFLDENNNYGQLARWGAIVSTNSLTHVFPQPNGTSFLTPLSVSISDSGVDSEFSWKLFVPSGNSLHFESSTDLLNWQNDRTLSSAGGVVELRQRVAGERTRFFRVRSE